jgi:CHAT domain-containing protein
MTKRPLPSPLTSTMPERHWQRQRQRQVAEYHEPEVVEEGEEEMPLPTPSNPEAIDQLWDDVFAAKDAVVEPAEEDAETEKQDPEFSVTSMNDVIRTISRDDQLTDTDIETFRGNASLKIVLDFRDPYQEAMRLGLNKDGWEVLEDALKELQSPLQADCRSLKLAQVKILTDQGRKEEARKLLATCLGAATPQSEITVRSSPQDKRQFPTDRSYREMRELFDEVELELDMTLQAEDWAKAREIGTELFKIDPNYFDINKKIDRFQQCRRILHLGLLKEIEADEKSNRKQKRRLLEDALKLYNHGCYAVEVYHEIFDRADSNVFDFDHSDCANVFFSAARICAIFQNEGYADDEGRPISPQQFQCKGPDLTEEDWKQQALHFLEQGRSRALLESICRGIVVTSKATNIIKWTVSSLDRNDMPTLADMAVRALKKRSFGWARGDGSISSSRTNSRSQTMARDTIRDSIIADAPGIQECMEDAIEDDPIAQLEDAPERFRKTPPKLKTSNLPPPEDGTAGTSPSGILTPQQQEDVFAGMKWRMRWRKAQLYALTQVRPTIGALPTGGKFGSIDHIRRSLPPDTLLVEYALVSTTPSGILTIVATREEVKAAVWKRLNAANLRKGISQLRGSMTSQNMVARDASPFTARRPMSTWEREAVMDTLRGALVAPVEEHLGKKNKLIIVPSGDLTLVPWALFFDMPITVVPSLLIWNRLHNQKSAAYTKPKVSVISNAPIDAQRELENLPSYRDIPYSRMEALYIARAHGISPFLSDSMDRKEFERRTVGSQILHLCAHSTFNAKEPLKSSINLFQRPLTIADWRTLAIKADLVVFSSCLSALSKPYVSGSAIGFAHTLLGSGTKAFVGSLWPVDDAATLLLMAMFYEELRRPRSATDALYEAQRRMRNMKPAELNDIIAAVEELVDTDLSNEYVTAPWHYIDQLRSLEAKDLADEKYWAAFVLTGYGSGIIYPPPLIPV